ncbi:uncharacterized protein [Apostichopus japonicus]|uniref:uncharacterized protein n=1 Tax=Stichopus japonicus TaxID=307972 RepID=UPI003AB68D17
MKCITYLAWTVVLLVIPTSYGRSQPCSPLNCFVDPCAFAFCAAVPTAECRANYCDCSADFYQNRRRVECEQEPCTLPLKPGKCRAHFERWSFQNDECIPFIYGGCKGNANNFATEEECLLTCGGTSHPNLLW